MHEHEHDLEPGALRPKPSRVDTPDLGQMYKAGAAGRADVVGPAGLLGLQRAVGNNGVGAMLEDDRSPVHDVVGSGGQPLDTDTRADMESRLGHDFGDVRLHTDSAAHDSAVGVNANAYTVGSHVVFQRDKYDPSSTEGRTTLAHELTHVVQQRSGPVDGSPAAGGIQVSEPSDRFEREAASTAEQAMAAPAPTVEAAAPVGAAGAAVQREEMAEEEEAPVQGSFVQREEAEEEAVEE
ncbi:MAG TPA: DUF4157 domain-containing protein [Mycobacteriales bacterium]|nr:DUF4157 domain-containing protein [Mycobacteriales bacterium]